MNDALAVLQRLVRTDTEDTAAYDESAFDFLIPSQTASSNLWPPSESDLDVLLTPRDAQKAVEALPNLSSCAFRRNHANPLNV